MKLKAFFGVACPLRTVPLLQAACLVALALCALTAGGCDKGGIGMGIDEPGLYDKVELGKPLPADVWPPAAAPRLGASSCQTQHRAFEGDSARELVRAAVDADGNVVASHCLRTWRHKPLLGPGEEIVRFTLDLRVPGMPGSPAAVPAAATTPAGTMGATGPASAPTTKSAPAASAPAHLAPGDTPGAAPALRVAPASQVATKPAAPAAGGVAATSAPARGELLSMGTLAAASCLDAPLDENLLAVAKDQALSKASRPAPPGNWQEFGATVLARLNHERQYDQLPATDSPVASVADLVLLAEMVLESIPMQGEEWMDHVAWKRLDLPEALRKVPTALPDKVGQATWSHVEVTDAAGMAVTIDFPYAFHGAADHTRFSATLSNLGQGHVRVTLQSHRLTGQPQE